MVTKTLMNGKVTDTWHRPPCEYTTQEKCIRNKKRNAKWMKTGAVNAELGQSANQIRHNITRVINRAKQGIDVSYATFKKYGISENILNEINVIRQENGHKKIERTLLTEIQLGGAMQGIADAERQKVQLEMQQQRAIELMEQAQDEATRLRGEMVQVVGAAERTRQEALALGVVAPPLLTDRLTFSDLFAYFSAVYNGRNSGAGLENVTTTANMTNTLNFLTPPQSFNYNNNVNWLKTYFGNFPTKNNKGEVGVALDNVGCFLTDDNILPCILRREKKRGNVSDEFSVIKTFDAMQASSKQKNANAMVWWLSKYPGVFYIPNTFTDDDAEGYDLKEGPIGLQLKDLFTQLLGLAKKGVGEANRRAASKKNSASDIYEGDMIQYQQILDYVLKTPKYSNAFSAKPNQSKLFFLLYKEVPVRDNFGSLLIEREPITAVQKVGDQDKIYVPKPTSKDKQGKVYLNNYKTVNMPATYSGTVSYLLSEELTTFINKTLEFRPRKYLFVQAGFYTNNNIPPETNKQLYAAAQNEPGEQGQLSSALVKPVLKEMIDQNKIPVSADGTARNRSGTDFLRKTVIAEERVMTQNTNAKNAINNVLAKKMLHDTGTSELVYSATNIRPYETTTDNGKIRSWQIQVANSSEPELLNQWEREKGAGSSAATAGPSASTERARKGKAPAVAPIAETAAAKKATAAAAKKAAATAAAAKKAAEKAAAAAKKAPVKRTGTRTSARNANQN